MSDNINVKALSNLYTDPAKWGMWLCVGCITGIAEGNFLVFEAPCCRFPVFPAGTSILEKGMNSTDDNGRVHIVRRCAACLITAKGCIAPPDDVDEELKAITELLKVIYDPSKPAEHGEAKYQACTLAKNLRTRLDRAPYTPHAVKLRLHNGETSPDNLPQSAVYPRENTKSKAAQKAREQADQTHIESLAAERLNNLQNTPGGRGRKRKYDNVEHAEVLKKAREAEKVAKDAHRDHLASARPNGSKAGKTWDNKSSRLTKELAAARQKVQSLEALL